MGWESHRVGYPHEEDNTLVAREVIMKFAVMVGIAATVVLSAGRYDTARSFLHKEAIEGIKQIQALKYITPQEKQKYINEIITNAWQTRRAAEGITDSRVGRHSELPPESPSTQPYKRDQYKKCFDDCLGAGDKGTSCMWKCDPDGAKKLGIPR